MTDKRPKQIAQERGDVSWEEVLKEVQDKKEQLESANRLYQEEYPITSSVVVQQQSYREKLLVLDEIEFTESHYEYRFGYWVVSDEKLDDDGTISVVFGQFASVIPPEDIQALIQKAEQAEWTGPGPV